MTIEPQEVSTVTQYNPERVRKSMTLLLKKGDRYKLILDAFTNLECQRSCQLQIISRTVTCGTVSQVFRSAEQFAKKTVVINFGNKKVFVYESEKLVAIIPALNQVTLPMPGTGRIWLRSQLGSQVCTITTYIGCQCGTLQSEIDYYDKTVGESLL